MRRSQAALNAMLAVRARDAAIVYGDDRLGVAAASFLSEDGVPVAVMAGSEPALQDRLSRAALPFVSPGQRRFSASVARVARRCRQHWFVQVDTLANRSRVEAASEAAGEDRSAVVRVEGFWLRQQVQDDLSAGRLSTRGFSSVRTVSATAALARSRVQAFPPNFVLCPGSAGPTQLWIIGTGDAALETLLLVAKLAHSVWVPRPSLSLIGQSAPRALADIVKRAPEITDWVHIEARELGVQFPEAAEDLVETVGTAGATPAMVYVCVDDPGLAQAWRSSLVRAFLRCGWIPPVVVAVTAPAGASDGPELAEVCSPVIDRLPRLVHEAYVSEQIGKGAALGQWPSLRHWLELPFDFQEDNRVACDHYSIKLRDLFAVAAPLTAAGGHPFPMAADEIERLAEMEHLRWLASRCAMGWRYDNHRDDSRRLHPNIVGWDRLDEAAREKDRSPIVDMPAKFALIGQSLRRMRPMLVTPGAGTDRAALERYLAGLLAESPDNCPLVVVDSSHAITAASACGQATGRKVGIVLTADSLAGDVASAWSRIGVEAAFPYCVVRAPAMHAAELASLTGWTLGAPTA
jgi:hypothetical protein